MGSDSKRVCCPATGRCMPITRTSTSFANPAAVISRKTVPLPDLRTRQSAARKYRRRQCSNSARGDEPACQVGGSEYAPHPRADRDPLSRARDHIAGDKQFQGLPGVQFMAAEPAAIAQAVGIFKWPSGVWKDRSGRSRHGTPARSDARSRIRTGSGFRTNEGNAAKSSASGFHRCSRISALEVTSPRRSGPGPWLRSPSNP